jgi:hypothetical protein
MLERREWKINYVKQKRGSPWTAPRRLGMELLVCVRVRKGTAFMAGALIIFEMSVGRSPCAGTFSSRDRGLIIRAGENGGPGIN